MHQDEWKRVAGAYFCWATDLIVAHRKKRLSSESAKQVISSVERFLKARAGSMDLPESTLAPLKLTEDIDEVAGWITEQSTTWGYLSKQVCMLHKRDQHHL